VWGKPESNPVNRFVITSVSRHDWWDPVHSLGTHKGAWALQAKTVFGKLSLSPERHEPQSFHLLLRKSRVQIKRSDRNEENASEKIVSA